MADCKKCGARIGFVMNEASGKWHPVEYDSIDYNNDERNDEDQIIWDSGVHKSHRCVYANPKKGSSYDWYNKKEEAQKPPPTQPKSHHETLCVTRTAPKEVIQAAYRALARIHHPDAGGNLKKMQEINAAWEALK